MSNISSMASTKLSGRALRSAVLSTLLCIGVVATSHAGADEFRPGTTTLISKGQSGQVADAGNPSVSSDGRYVAFESWDRLTTEDTDDSMDIYRYDRVTGQTIMVSVNAPGLSSTSCNFEPSITSDGGKVAYRAGGGGGGTIGRGCYTGYAVLRNIETASSSYISGSVGSRAIELSEDGHYLGMLYEDGWSDYRAAVVDLSSGTIPWQSEVICEACVLPVPDEIAISADGRKIAYEQPYWVIRVHDRDPDGNGIFDEPGKSSTTTESILPDGNIASSGVSPSLSDDGRFLAFVGEYKAAHPPLSQVYVRNLQTAKTESVAVSSIGVPTVSLSAAPSISQDGRFVAFYSQDPFIPPGDTNPSLDVYVRDRQEHKTYLASVLPDGSQNSGFDATSPSISSDGNFVAFSTELVSYQNENNFSRSLYLRDLWTQCTNTCLPNPSFVPPEPPPPPTPPSLPGCTAYAKAPKCAYTAGGTRVSWTGAATYWCVKVFVGQGPAIRNQFCRSYYDTPYSGSFGTVQGDLVELSLAKTYAGVLWLYSDEASGIAEGWVHAEDG